MSAKGGSPKYTVLYFDLRGRAEILRLILKQAGVEFEDKRLVGDTWRADFKQKMPFKTMPCLKVGDKIIGQSLAAARYLAKEHGLAGEGNMEQAIVDQVVDMTMDILLPMTMTRYAANDEAKKAAEVKIEPLLAVLEEYKTGTGTDYFAGNSLTWADLQAFNLVSTIYNIDQLKSKLDGKENLLKHMKMVAELPNIKKWIEERPVTSM